jgi:hypothetical protein
MGQPFGGQQLPIQNMTPAVMPQQASIQPMQAGTPQGMDFGAANLANALRAGNTGDKKDMTMGQKWDSNVKKWEDFGNMAGAAYDKIGSWFGD